VEDLQLVIELTEIQQIQSKESFSQFETFSQNKHNIYGYTDSKGLKITCQNIQHVLRKLDEIKYNIGNMRDEFKPHILGMCEKN
jgi:hypothetical protein